jgi:hypothetical protein
MYSPLLYTSAPAWWPAFLPFSAAMLILPFPGLFRFTCYYYRGAYYKAFWADPPACAVGEPRKTYRGEQWFPLVFQNIHRYFMYLAVAILFVLGYDAWVAMWFPAPGGGTQFGIGVGTVILTVNVVLLSGYTLGCHSMRHLVGGLLDVMSNRPVRKTAYICSSALNRAHMRWAWASLFWVGLSDIYVRLCSMGIFTDYRIF